MPDDSAHEPDDASIFSRGSLKLTFELIRKTNPSLALAIRNLTAKEPVCNTSEQSDRRNSDYFKVELDTFEVRAVVETLMELVQAGALPNSNPGLTIVAKSLIDDWTKLARKMFEELPDSEKS